MRRGEGLETETNSPMAMVQAPATSLVMPEWSMALVVWLTVSTPIMREATETVVVSVQDGGPEPLSPGLIVHWRGWIADCDLGGRFVSSFFVRDGAERM